MKKCDIVRSNKTVYEINDDVSLHLQLNSSWLEVMGISVPVSPERIHWGPHSEVLIRHYVDELTQAAIVQAVYEFHNLEKEEAHEALRA